MDTTDEYISFDENGICTRCNEFKQRILPDWNYGKEYQRKFENFHCNKEKGGIVRYGKLP